MYSIFVYNRLRMNGNKSSRVILDVCRFFCSIHMWKCTLHISFSTLGNISSELQLIENETLLTFTLPMLFYGCVCVAFYRFTTSICNFKCTFRIMKPYRACVCVPCVKCQRCMIFFFSKKTFSQSINFIHFILWTLKILIVENGNFECTLSLLVLNGKAQKALRVGQLNAERKKEQKMTYYNWKDAILL